MKLGYLISKTLCTLGEGLGRASIYRLKRAKNVIFERKIPYSQNPQLYLNICRPKSPKEDEKLPVFVYIHGGGWISGAPEGRESLVSNIASEGYFTISICYGLAPKYRHPAPVINIYDALAWLITNKDKYNLDLDRLYVGGESAGGHLTATVGAISANPEYKNRFALNEISKDLKFSGLLLVCGIYDMDEGADSGFPFIKSYIQTYGGKSIKELRNEESYKDMSPYGYINENFPQSFILSAARDPLKCCSKSLSEKLSELNVKHILHHEKGLFAVHAFLVAQVLPESRRTMPKVLDFLKNGAE